MAPETRLLKTLDEFVPKIGGRVFYRGPSLELGGACAACPIEAVNQTLCPVNVSSEIRCTSGCEKCPIQVVGQPRPLDQEIEIEINPYYCPVTGECPLYREFKKAATYLWKEVDGFKDGEQPPETGRHRRGWPVAVRWDGVEVEYLPVFAKDEEGKYTIARWQECYTERDVYLVRERIFPFRIVLEE